MYVGFGPGFYVRTTFGAPPLGLVNMYAEAAPNQKDRQYTLNPTPGLTAYKELSGTIRGIFYQQGVFGNDIFVVHGANLSRINEAGTVTSVSAAVAGTEAVSAAFSTIDQMILVAGGNVYSYDGTTFAEESIQSSTIQYSNLTDTFEVGDVITGGTSTETANVLAVNGVTSLEVDTLSGDFTIGETITGAPSAATATLDSITGDLNFISVAYIDGRFVVIPDNSSRFYWSEILSTTFLPLNFATAEFSGDDLVALVSQRNAIVLFGTTTTEVWVSTGDANAPFQRDTRGIVEKGCIGPRAAVLVNQAIVWTGADRVVYRLDGYQATPISTPAISENMGSADTRMSFYIEDGHQFVLVSQPDSAYVFDTSTGEWHERRSRDTDGYIPFAYVFRGGNHYAASRYDGDIYTQSKTVYTEDGNILAREASVFVPSQSAISCDTVVLDGARGAGLIAGQGENPIILLDWSDDGGKSYTNARNLYPGRVGEFSTRMFTTRLGTLRPPGRVFRVRFTDPTLFRLDGLRINEVDY